MRGIIFRTFQNFIEARFGYETVDGLLLKGDYPNDGGFSAAGNYDPACLMELIEASSELFGGSTEKASHEFGRFAFAHLVNRFKTAYGSVDSALNSSDAYAFLENLNVIHFSELNKLYPDAKFPKFEIERLGERHIAITYASPLDLPSFVCGLITGCLEYYDEPSKVRMTRLDQRKRIDGHDCPLYRFEVGDGL